MQLPGRPTRDCLLADVSRDGRTALKIWNMNEVNGVVGVFNLQVRKQWGCLACRCGKDRLQGWLS